MAVQSLLPNKETISKLNSILLTVVIALLGWTVKGVQELREGSAANAVMMVAAKETADRWALETQFLRSRVDKQELDIAIIKVKMGLKEN